MAISFAWLPRFPSRPTTPVDVPAPPPEGRFTLVVLDPGHGGEDSGSIKAGLMEKELALDVAQRAERLLRRRGMATLLTRTGDTYVSLAERAAVANAQNKCVFVSIHFDDAAKSAATGVETYYAGRQVSNSTTVAPWWPFLQQAVLEYPNVESQSLAGFIQEALVTRTQAVDRGTSPQQFYVIAAVRHPAVLVEGGFLTNSEEMHKLATSEYREQIAAAISDGVMRYREILKGQETPLAVDLPGGD